jgi:hypothetical protein
MSKKNRRTMLPRRTQIRLPCEAVASVDTVSSSLLRAYYPGNNGSLTPETVMTLRSSKRSLAAVGSLTCDFGCIRWSRWREPWQQSLSEIVVAAPAEVGDWQIPWDITWLTIARIEAQLLGTYPRANLAKQAFATAPRDSPTPGRRSKIFVTVRLCKKGR